MTKRTSTTEPRDPNRLPETNRQNRLTRASLFRSFGWATAVFGVVLLTVVLSGAIGSRSSPSAILAYVAAVLCVGGAILLWRAWLGETKAVQGARLRARSRSDLRKGRSGTRESDAQNKTYYVRGVSDPISERRILSALLVAVVVGAGALGAATYGDIGASGALLVALLALGFGLLGVYLTYVLFRHVK
jgi:hypothetical protein